MADSQTDDISWVTVHYFNQDGPWDVRWIKPLSSRSDKLFICFTLTKSAMASCYYKHLLEQFVLQLHTTGKQYSINDPVMHSSCGTVPVRLVAYMDMPESAIKQSLWSVVHYIKLISLKNNHHNSSHTSTYTNCLAVQGQTKLFQSEDSS